MVRQPVALLSTIRTDPELEVHSIDGDKLSSKHAMPALMKNKFAVNDVPSDSTAKMNLESSSSNSRKNRVSIDTTNEALNSCNDYGYDVTDSEDCGESKIDLGYHFTWSDEDEPTYLDQQGFGLNVYESIRAISKEASKKIDAVLAVDHVDQLQEEMRKLRSEIKRRSADYSELKGVVQVKDHQIGTLELERDLYKADTTKLANDLETCLLKLRLVGGSTSPVSIGYGDSLAKETVKGKEMNIANRSLSNPAESTISVNDNNDTVPLSPMLPIKKRLDPQSCTESPNDTVETVSTLTSGTGAASISSNRSYTTTPLITPPRPSKLLPVIENVEKSHQDTFPNRDIFTYHKLNQRNVSNDVEASQQQRRKNILSFAFCWGNNNYKKRGFVPVQSIPMQMQNSISSTGTYPHTTEKMGAVYDSPGRFHQPHGILQGQITDMGQRLHSSIKTSENLRRRIAMIHLYYEEHIDQLDSRLLDACVNKTKMQFDFSGQQSRLDRHHEPAVMDLESKIRQHEQEIQLLRKPRVVTFNI